MSKPRQKVGALQYALPVQLFALQVRKYKLLLLFWLIVLGMISGSIGKGIRIDISFPRTRIFGRREFCQLAAHWSDIRHLCIFLPHHPIYQ